MGLLGIKQSFFPEQLVDRHFRVVETKESWLECMEFDLRIQGEAFIADSLSQRCNARFRFVDFVKNLASICRVKAVSWVARGEHETHSEAKVSRNYSEQVMRYCASSLMALVLQMSAAC